MRVGCHRRQTPRSWYRGATPRFAPPMTEVPGEDVDLDDVWSDLRPGTDLAPEGKRGREAQRREVIIFLYTYVVRRTPYTDVPKLSVPSYVHMYS